jgi:hypothetical protein
MIQSIKSRSTTELAMHKMDATKTHITAPISIGMLAIFTLVSCRDACSSDLLFDRKSPDGAREAGFYKKNCGATTGYIYEVRVSRGGEPSSSGETVLRFDDNHAVRWPDDDREVLALSWNSGGTLSVVLRQPVRVFEEERSSGGVTVSFQFVPGTRKL